jgi:hypothetical protein
MNIRPPLLALFTAVYLSALTEAAAAQQAVPTDTELRSAYCASVIRGDIDLQQKMIAQIDAAVKSAPTPELQQQAIKASTELHEGLTKIETVRDRLKLYLLPRIGSLDPIAITAAMHRGEADVQEVMAMVNRCSAKCDPLPGDQRATCNASCVDNDLIARVKACTNPTWLPF